MEEVTPLEAERGHTKTTPILLRWGVERSCSIISVHDEAERVHGPLTLIIQSEMRVRVVFECVRVGPGHVARVLGAYFLGAERSMGDMNDAEQGLRVSEVDGAGEALVTHLLANKFKLAGTCFLRLITARPNAQIDTRLTRLRS